MIDVHCHLDQYEHPDAYVERAERLHTTIVAVTNLPSHFAVALQHLKDSRFVRPALGLHPLLADEHLKELPAFFRLLPRADYVGEIGLDFSPRGRSTTQVQLATLRAILPALRAKPRFISVHSRGAEDALLEMLTTHGVGPVVFHWFTGSRAALRSVFDRGHYVSVNEAMTISKSGPGTLAHIPRNRILTETDGPFARCFGRSLQPAEVCRVIDYLATLWKCKQSDVEAQITENFQRITSRIM